MYVSDQGSGDDTTMNGIYMWCKEDGEFGYSGHWGDWEVGTHTCLEGFSGVKIKLHSQQASCN